MKKVLTLLYSSLILIFCLPLVGCSEQPLNTDKPTTPEYQPGLQWFQVTKLVEASNNAQPLFPTDGGPRQHTDYNHAPYFWKSEWHAYFLGDKYSYIGDDWTDMWLVQRRHLSDGVWSTNTDYWLYRESTGKVFYLDWSNYSLGNEAYLLKQAAKDIKEGTLEPNRQEMQ